METIQYLGLSETIKLILPHLVRAGDLAKIIQAKPVTSTIPTAPTQKTGNAFASALTDADLAVQTYLATVLLTNLRDVSFAGEEGDADHVSAYFPSDAPYKITLDPIDGTLFFKDGLECWDIILSIYHHGELVAVVMCQPHRSRVLIGIKDEGSFETSRSDALDGRPWKRLRLPRAKSRIIMVDSKLPAEVNQVLTAQGFQSLDYETYKSGQPWLWSQRHLFEGEICGFIRHTKVQSIDVGAISFIASLCGCLHLAEQIDPKDASRDFHKLLCIRQGTCSPNSLGSILSAIFPAPNPAPIPPSIPPPE